MPEKTVLSNRQKDQLFTMLKDDPKFRELMKEDWKRALETVKIKPDAVAKGVLTRNEIESFLGQRAGWTIEIVIAAHRPDMEAIQLKEAVNFEAR
ncbi:MAG: hypothetical protein IT161_24765 [Bryobacterales bacterium]|nr:hypothetical protein [Bryobacterales bacterium]